MAENTFHLVIASVGERYFDGAARSVTLPTTAGEATILPHHEALVATLKSGKAVVRDSLGEKKEFDIEGGVVEVTSERVVVLL